MKEVIRYLSYILIVIAFILILGTCGSMDTNTISEAHAWFRFLIIITLIGFGLIGLHCTVEKDEYDY